MREGSLLLKDGRSLSYCIAGNPGGEPIFHMHGIPGSRLEAALIAEYLDRPDLCIIGMDRPGSGHSDMQRGFRVGDIPADVAALADHLGYERFALMGYSGGGPFALACAARIPERLKAVGVISGVGPAEVGSQGMHESNRKKFNLAQSMPWLVEQMISFGFRGMKGKPERLAAQLEKVWAQMPEADRRVLQDQHFREWMVRETLDAIDRGTAGFAHEEILMASAWDFKLEEIHLRPIYLWHGCLDRNVPEAMARAVAERIPGCQAFFFPDDGHLSLIYHHGKEFVERLTEG